jgi:hypothetical protein
MKKYMQILILTLFTICGYVIVINEPVEIFLPMSPKESYKKMQNNYYFTWQVVFMQTGITI